MVLPASSSGEALPSPFWFVSVFIDEILSLIVLSLCITRMLVLLVLEQVRLLSGPERHRASVCVICSKFACLDCAEAKVAHFSRLPAGISASARGGQRCDRQANGVGLGVTGAFEEIPTCSLHGASQAETLHTHEHVSAAHCASAAQPIPASQHTVQVPGNIPDSVPVEPEPVRGKKVKNLSRDGLPSFPSRDKKTVTFASENSAAPGKVQGASGEDPDDDLVRMRQALETEKEMVEQLKAELEQERAAASAAAVATMDLIQKLQAEKASVQLESLQQRRLLEQKSDLKELEELREIVATQDEMMLKLEEEVQMYHTAVELMTPATASPSRGAMKDLRRSRSERKPVAAALLELDDVDGPVVLVPGQQSRSSSTSMVPPDGESLGSDSIRAKMSAESSI